MPRRHATCVLNRFVRLARVRVCARLGAEGGRLTKAHATTLSCVRLAVAATLAPRSLSVDSGPLSLATALLQERIYSALDYFVVGPLL